MGSIVFELKEQLHHHKYNWPLSMVRYPLQFAPGEARSDSFRLTGPAGAEAPLQIVAEAVEDGWLLKGELLFLSDLPQGACYRYRLDYEGRQTAANGAKAEGGAQAGAGQEGPAHATNGPKAEGGVQAGYGREGPAQKGVGLAYAGPGPEGHGFHEVPAVAARLLEDGTLVADNGLLGITVPDAAGGVKAKPEKTGREPQAAPSLFGLTASGGKELAQAVLRGGPPIRAVESICLASGPIMLEQAVQVAFEDGSGYRLRLRLIAGMEWLELEEDIQGLEPEAAACLELCWHGLAPSRRYTKYRGAEPVDAYLEPGGALPYKLLPFDSWRSWHRTKTAAFIDDANDLAAGLWVHDALKWRDGEFALWRSSDTLAVSFLWQKREEADVAPVAGRDNSAHSRHRECCSSYAEGCGGAKEGRGQAVLVWRYPLRGSGSRCTAIAVYNAGRCPVAGNGAPGAEADKADGAGTDKDVPAYIDCLYLWHQLIALDKVKDWVLDWEEPQEQYPLLFDPGRLPQSIHWWYFQRSGQPCPADMEQVIDKLSFSFNQVASTSPVTSREFASWVPLFDLSAREMTPEQFRRFKAASAFMAYVREDENLMPARTMLAGHPNFLADIKAVPGLMAALFPHHPHGGRWTEDVGKAFALNLKYHTRPRVEAWESEGGRWTENLGCYVWAALVPMVRTAWALRKTRQADVLLAPNIVKLGGWLLHSMSAPVSGTRSYPPQGAHSGVHLDPLPAAYALRVLGELLLQYDPLLAEQLLAVCPADSPGFESSGGDVWRQMLESPLRGNLGTPPEWGSRKYTGYGYVLRSAGGTPGEMSVHVQQLDDGPNYRWGRAAEGGCGSVYYYAEGKRYSYNRPEDIGDDNMGDVEAGSNFAVLKGHEYCSIGRNELTEPLYNMGFAQYVRLQAGPRARPLYRSRSVLMSGNDYIVLYDEVADMRVRGRFSWFARKGGELPAIYQLKPGVPGVSVVPAGPVDQPPVAPGKYAKAKQTTGYPDGSIGKYFDGFGDFLTLVTHRETWQPQIVDVRAAPYGAKIALCGRTDYIFRSGTRLQHQEGGLAFEGYAGIVRVHGPDWVEAALFDGTRIGFGDITVTAQGGTVAYTWKNGFLKGQSHSKAPMSIGLALNGKCSPRDGFRLFVNGQEQPYDIAPEASGIRFTLPAGCSSWQWTQGAAIPGRAFIQATEVAAGQVKAIWSQTPGAAGYRLAISQDNGASWNPAASASVKESSRTLDGFANGVKLHLRVQAVSGGLEEGEWSPAYPVYITDQAPPPPQGLRLKRTEDGIQAAWGAVLGVAGYRLYRRPAAAAGQALQLIYEGADCFFTDRHPGGMDYGSTPVYEYLVSAVNGNGEGELSQAASTEAGGMIDFDPKPEETFRRYIRSHEYGYNGFDHLANAVKGTLPPYPQ